MPICPGCKLNKPALPVMGTCCSWPCLDLANAARTARPGAVTPPRVVPKPLPAPTVRSFFAGLPRGALVAARRENNGNRLFYHQTAAPGPEALRPSVYLQDYLLRNKIPFKGKVIVNYATEGWINQNSGLEQTLASQEPDVLDAEVTPTAVDGLLKGWDQFSLDKLGPKPGLTALADAAAPADVSKARRMYMLGTFCLLKKFGLVGKSRSQGHNIAAMLVSGEGEVLSWGVNTGEYRHAEVNTIINYFRLNPTASRLPAKSVLFSTLKPCLMCSTLIKSTWHSDGEPRVWYGMMDEGGSGSTPLLGAWSNEFKLVELEREASELTKPDAKPDAKSEAKPAPVKTGTKPVRVGPKDDKEDLYAKLNSSRVGAPKMSAADWVDKSDEVLRLFDAAQTTFISKSDKPRDDGPRKKVLAHLKPFVT